MAPVKTDRRKKNHSSNSRINPTSGRNKLTKSSYSSLVQVVAPPPLLDNPAGTHVLRLVFARHFSEARL